MKLHKILIPLSGMAALAAFAATPTPVAEANVEARSGSSVAGTVTFAPAADKVRVEVHLSGLTPGAHGFHVHEAGDCSAADASSAKGHFNPAAKPHGEHAGDMMNLIADASGNANTDFELAQFSLSEGENGIIGRSVVVHADPDDYKSQPAGNSGKRVACGTIRLH